MSLAELRPEVEEPRRGKEAGDKCHAIGGPTPTVRSGVIVAGGRSTRFGEADKAVADLAGTPMIRRVADRIVDVVEDLVVNCRPDQTSAIEAAMAGYPHAVSYAEDETPDLGPVAGIRNGLAAATGEFAFVVACDMPFVDPAIAEHLFERCMDHDGAVPRLEDGWYQTMQAVYRVSPMRAACETVLETRDHPRILAPLEELDYVVVDSEELTRVGSLDSFENVNTVEELEAARDRLTNT